MKLLTTLLFVFCSVTLLVQCKSDGASQTASTEQTINSTKGLLSNAGITAEYVQLIVDSCSHVDMIFNDFPISISQTEPSSIIGDLTYLSPNAMNVIPENCKPLGRKVYNGNGRILIEADLYFSEECQFMVFIQNEQALFANQMNDKGINFYNNLLAQVQEQYNKQ
jgi:hypothetical protein